MVGKVGGSLIVAVLVFGAVLFGPGRTSTLSSDIGSVTATPPNSLAPMAVDSTCVCSCGINCDGACAFSFRGCDIGIAIVCVANCCAAAPNPDCKGPGGVLGSVEGSPGMSVVSFASFPAE